jgi:hypothetical protein
MILQRKKAGKMIFDGFGADMLTCVMVVCKIKMGRCHISKILPNFLHLRPISVIFVFAYVRMLM